jgi:hypothetical protein
VGSFDEEKKSELEKLVVHFRQLFSTGERVRYVLCCACAGEGYGGVDWLRYVLCCTGEGYGGVDWLCL